MLVAIEIEKTAAAERKAGFGVALGVEFYKLNSVWGEIADKRDVMLFCHFVKDGDEVFIFYFCDVDFVLFIGFFCVERRQCDSATTDYCVAHSADYIVAHRANIEFRAQNV